MRFRTDCDTRTACCEQWPKFGAKTNARSGVWSGGAPVQSSEAEGKGEMDKRSAESTYAYPEIAFCDPEKKSGNVGTKK